MAELVSEWSKEMDCKSIIREFESHPALKIKIKRNSKWKTLT